MLGNNAKSMFSTKNHKLAHTGFSRDTHGRGGVEEASREVEGSCSRRAHVRGGFEEASRSVEGKCHHKITSSMFQKTTKTFKTLQFHAKPKKNKKKIWNQCFQQYSCVSLIFVSALDSRRLSVSSKLFVFLTASHLMRRSHLWSADNQELIFGRLLARSWYFKLWRVDSHGFIFDRMNTWFSWSVDIHGFTCDDLCIFEMHGKAPTSCVLISTPPFLSYCKQAKSLAYCLTWSW